MPVPTHGYDCQTRIFPVRCKTCKKEPIWIFSCTCGSVVRFDAKGPPWPEHECADDVRGWALIDMARNMGYRVDDPRLLAFAFPGSTVPKLPAAPPPFERAEPTTADSFDVFGLVREVIPASRAIEAVKTLGALGYALLKVSAHERLWQITVADTSSSPRMTYTCLVPARFSPARFAVGRRAFATIRGVNAGPVKAWIVDAIEDVVE